jgi:hypothetical protein
MTLDERLAIGMKAHEYMEAGNKAEAEFGSDWLAT